jgi:hypothetical protein
MAATGAELFTSREVLGIERVSPPRQPFFGRATSGGFMAEARRVFNSLRVARASGRASFPVGRRHASVRLLAKPLSFEYDD